MVKIGKKAPPTAYNVYKIGPAYNRIISGTWKINTAAAQLLNGFFHGWPSAVNDEVEYKFSHKAGNFTLVVLCLGRVAGAEATVYLDGAAQGTIDFYRAVQEYNLMLTCPLAILSDGEHTLTLKSTGIGGGGAGGWEINITAWWIKD